jgi:signal transduction histidine kinase
MKKVALVFVVAVFVPSLMLAWLAVRSLRDQEYLLQRQQSLLYQGVADAVANEAQNRLSALESEFKETISAMLATNSQDPVVTFDERLRRRWPLAEVGFVVTSTAGLVCPSPASRPDARLFCANNGTFLSCRESAEIYWNAGKAGGNTIDNNAGVNGPAQVANANASPGNDNEWAGNFKNKSPLPRNVMPQRQEYAAPTKGQQIEQTQSFSKIAASEAEFCQLTSSGTEGMLARFVDNKLNLLFWCRPPQSAQSVYGAQIALPRLIEKLKGAFEQVERPLREEICIVLLDDNARPVALSHPGFQAPWKHPFVATEIGEALPHWELGVYLINPAKLTASARTLKLTLGLLIGVLVLAIGIGSWLIFADLNRQLTLARQKTDFVSNVSHELKTPLTSIRMFSELLAEGRVHDAAKQRNYLGIITAETARLTRLINNVLDFARMERGEKEYKFQPFDLRALAHETAETYRPHLEANGFRFDCELPDHSVMVNGDRDALAQVLVNLLSNAEKYSNSQKEIALRLEAPAQDRQCAELKVLDRGVGVPRGCEQKIFEQFFRAHDSLSSGVQGSGLGLTLARKIARAHGGDVEYEARGGGGSCFVLRVAMS